MKIIAGLGFDGRLPNEVQERLGELVVGPAGLLGELEFRAGLAPPARSHAERVVRYRRVLESCSRESFFRKSLTADPVATAESLLAWRDYALDHGWKATSGTVSPGRLAALAEVEGHVQGLSPCLSERIASLIPRLDLIAQAVEQIVLLDPVSDWSVALASLFTAVAESGVEVRVEVPKRIAGAPADTDLGRLQRALLDPDRATAPLSLTDDGTLGLFRCIEPQAGARALVAGLSQLDNHLLIAGRDTFVLGAAARAEGLPNPGLGARSLWRPAAQLLTLLMQIAVSPPSADVVLQYLTLPVGPFGRLRRDLAGMFIDQPGYDPAAWQAFIDAEVQRRREWDTRFDEDALRDRIQSWLPVGRAGHSSRLSLETAIALSDQVRDYWRARYGASLDAESAGVREMLAAFEGADGMSAALRSWGGENIDIEHLQRLLDLSSEASATPLTQVRQVGGVSCVESPEAARLMKRPPAHVLWWEPTVEDVPRPPPFDSTEIAALPDVPDAQVREQLARAGFERRLWPVISATDSAALVTIETSPDLLRLHLERLLPPSLWRGFEAALIDGHEVEGAVLPNAEPLAELPLPTDTRWWNLDRRLVCPRQQESYSGLVALAERPHEYVLAYCARLSQGSIDDIPVDSRLKGNLGHRIIEEWFAEHPWTGKAPDRGAVRTWLNMALDRIIAAAGLPLAAPGRRAERLAFQDIIFHALVKLFGHFEDAGVLEVRVELNLSRDMPEMPGSGSEVVGTLDLLGRLSDGEDGLRRWVIVDVKWGGEKNRAAELREGRYLQLATYTQLLRALGPGRVSDFAYFVLRSGNLLSTRKAPFPNARQITPDDPSLDPEDVWQALVTTVDWRCRQLGAGCVEVTRSISPPTEESVPPAGALPPVEMGQANGSSGYANHGSKHRQSFKVTDPWRVLTGNIRS